MLQYEGDMWGLTLRQQFMSQDIWTVVVSVKKLRAHYMQYICHMLGDYAMTSPQGPYSQKGLARV